MANDTSEKIKSRQKERDRARREKESGKKEIEPDDFPGDGMAKRVATKLNENKKRKDNRLADIMRQIKGK